MNMSVLFNILASITMWTSFGLQISATTVNDWVVYDGGDTHAGLFRTCTVGVCSFLGSTPWLNAVRAFVIMGVVLAGVGNSMYVAGYHRYMKTLASVGTATIVTAAIFTMIGTSIYTAYTPATVNQSHGYGFIVAWLCFGLRFIASIFALVSILTMRDDRRVISVQEKQQQDS